MARLRIRFDIENSAKIVGDPWATIYMGLGMRKTVSVKRRKGTIVTLDITRGTEKDVRMLNDLGYKVEKAKAQPH